MASSLSRPLPGDVVVEVFCPRNRNWMFPITQEVLRGAWRQSELRFLPSSCRRPRGERQ
jgi:hypothetical protein